MAKLGRYAKAYPAVRFSEFPGWTANAAPASVVAESANGTNEEAFTYYFLQEDYTVTSGIYLDENVAFDRVTDEWRSFCTVVLQFKPPVAVNGAAENTRNSSPEAQIAAP